VPEQPCEECDGSGRQVRARTWDVEIPPGIESGQRIRISGAGHAGEPGGPPGDLYVEVVVADDPRFERHGSDLATVARISATRAMLGGTVEVPTLDGDREVEVRAGAQPGETVTLSGLGLPPLRGSSRGDQHVVLDVVVPTGLSDEQQRLASSLEEGLEASNLEPEGSQGRRFWRRRRAG
jgi:molecular chaperone DnaJ